MSITRYNPWQQHGTVLQDEIKQLNAVLEPLGATLVDEE